MLLPAARNLLQKNSRRHNRFNFYRTRHWHKRTKIESSYFLHQIKLFFHGSRITVLSFAVLRHEKQKIESSYFLTEAIQPVYFRLITENIDQPKSSYFFHGSRITILSFTVLRHEKQKIESSYFLTEAVKPVYFRLITENIDQPKSSYFFHGSRITVFRSYRTRQRHKEPIVESSYFLRKPYNRLTSNLLQRHSLVTKNFLSLIV